MTNTGTVPQTLEGFTDFYMTRRAALLGKLATMLAVAE